MVRTKILVTIAVFAIFTHSISFVHRHRCTAYFPQFNCECDKISNDVWYRHKNCMQVWGWGVKIMSATFRGGPLNLAVGSGEALQRPQGVCRGRVSAEIEFGALKSDSWWLPQF